MGTTVFIGSSSESLKIASEIESCLTESGLFPSLWTTCFKPGDVTVERLLALASEFDASIFLFFPDDIARVRGEQYPIVRDNVIFEAGMFMKTGGPKRTLIVTRPPQPHIISDLKGLTFLTMQSFETDQQMKTVVRAMCARIVEHLRMTDPLSGGCQQLVGEWSGELIQRIGKATSVAHLAMSARFSVNGNQIIGQSKIATKNSQEPSRGITLRGHEVDVSYFKLEYTYDGVPKEHLINVGGSILLYWDEQTDRLDGKYVGYGLVSRDIVSGSVILSRTRFPLARRDPPRPKPRPT